MGSNKEWLLLNLSKEEKVKRIILVTLTVLMVSAIIFGGCAKPAEEAPTTPTAPAEKPIEWRFCSFDPPQGMIAKPTIAWIKELEEATDGRMKINPYWSESLVKVAGLFDAVASGTADIGHIVTGPIAERVSLTALSNLPAIFETPHQTGQTMMALFNKYEEMREQFAPTKVVWFTNPGPVDIYSNRPVHTLEDLKGLKIACTAKYEVLSWEALGGTVVPISSVEKYHALETGIIDAGSGDWMELWVWKLYEVTKYRTGNTTGLIKGAPTAMNIESYNKLPEDIKRIFDEVTAPMTKLANESYEKDYFELVEEIREFDKKVGNPEFYYLPAAEKAKWAEVLQPVNLEWVKENEAKGYPAGAILEDAIAFAEQYK